jgi:cystathionine beta-lyase family protein involved in aluminum resistance
MDMPSEIFHYHSWEKATEQVKVKLERNSKGYNWEVSFAGEDADKVLAVIRETNAKMQSEYGDRAG